MEQTGALVLFMKRVLLLCVSVEPSSRKTCSSVDVPVLKPGYSFKSQVEIC